MIQFLIEHQFWAAVALYWIFSAAVSSMPERATASGSPEIDIKPRLGPPPIPERAFELPTNSLITRTSGSTLLQVTAAYRFSAEGRGARKDRFPT